MTLSDVEAVFDDRRVLKPYRLGTVARSGRIKNERGVLGRGSVARREVLYDGRTAAEFRISKHPGGRFPPQHEYVLEIWKAGALDRPAGGPVKFRQKFAKIVAEILLPELIERDQDRCTTVMQQKFDFVFLRPCAERSNHGTEQPCAEACLKPFDPVADQKRDTRASHNAISTKSRRHCTRALLQRQIIGGSGTHNRGEMVRAAARLLAQQLEKRSAVRRLHPSLPDERRFDQRFLGDRTRPYTSKNFYILISNFIRNPRQAIVMRTPAATAGDVPRQGCAQPKDPRGPETELMDGGRQRICRRKELRDMSERLAALLKPFGREKAARSTYF